MRGYTRVNRQFFYNFVSYVMWDSFYNDHVLHKADA